jgi:hypothetical protein
MEEYSCQLLHVRGINEVPTFELLVPEYSPFQVETAVEKLKRYVIRY